MAAGVSGATELNKRLCGFRFIFFVMSDMDESFRTETLVQVILCFDTKSKIVIIIMCSPSIPDTRQRPIQRRYLSTWYLLLFETSSVWGGDLSGGFQGIGSCLWPLSQICWAILKHNLLFKQCPTSSKSNDRHLHWLLFTSTTPPGHFVGGNFKHAL